MHITEFKEDFIKDYLEIRQSEVDSRSKLPQSRGNSNLAVVKATLSKALSLVFKEELGFFDFPLIGVEKRYFYEAMLGFRANHIEQAYYSLQSSKADFHNAYQQMLNSEKYHLQIYAACALGLKTFEDEEAEDYAKEVLAKLQTNTNRKLGMYFVFLRGVTENIIQPLKNRLTDEKIVQFMEKHKIEVSLDETLGEIIAKLDDLDSKARKELESGELKDRLNISLSLEISHFLNNGRTESEAH